MSSKSTVEILPKKSWPQRLLEISDPPEQLYIRGAVPNYENKFLCVVGARKYSDYGRQACESLIAGLSGFPITIISGLALGIDAIAHNSALQAGLTTVAVPGSGLDESILYPRVHLQLARKIMEKGGALISEFEPDFQATPWSFPKRNRIMAGMSDAVLVIEAERKSGTLITSRLATEYNRDVFTVPGSIFSKNSEGPHMLIRLGATPITKSEDIIVALGLEKDETKISTKDYSDCSPNEKIILELLSVNPLEKNELARNSNLSSSDLNSTLSILEIKGLIVESLGEIRLS